MQARIRCREKDAEYIQMEAAHASVVSKHFPATYCFPPNILSAGSNGGASNSPSDGRNNRRRARGPRIGPPQSGSECMLTAKAWRYAVRLAFPVICAPHTVTLALPAHRPARVSPPNKLPDIDPKLSISSSKVQAALCCLLCNLTFPHVVRLVQSPGPHLRQHHPVIVTQRPDKVQHCICPQWTVSNPLQQAAPKAHSRLFKHPCPPCHGPSSRSAPFTRSKPSTQRSAIAQPYPSFRAVLRPEMNP